MVKRVLIILAMVLWAAQAGAAEKAIYVDREWESSTWSAYQVVSKLNGYNHVIVMLGQTDPATIKTGSLEYFISLAHRRGMRVSILLNVSDGTDSIFKPDYPARVASFFASYARKYDADGINLDTVRTRFGHGLCDTDYCRNDFFQKYGITIDTVKADTDYNGWLSPYRPIMTDWNSAVVTRAVEAIRAAVKAVKPDTEISVSSVAHPVWEMEGALPVQWLNDGLIDHFYHMDYSNQVNVADLNKYLIPFVDKSRFTVALGNFYSWAWEPEKTWWQMYSRDPAHVDALIKSIEGIGDGYAIYSYRFLR